MAKHYKYEAELHHNHYVGWLNCEIDYLKKYYRKVPLTEISLSLGRTYKTVAHRVYMLKKQGEIPW